MARSGYHQATPTNATHTESPDTRVGHPVAVVPTAIALGSNLGDRFGHLTWAVERLHEVLSHLRVSTFIETEAVDVPEPQPPYLNAVVVGETFLDPPGILHRLLALERARGRTRPSFRAPRTLDLDLILFGDRIVTLPDLVVPHPHFRERDFVLQPLTELAGAWIDPVTGNTVEELFRRRRGSGR